ncbi:MAG: hypothetical protein WCE23_06505 [Candidatus Binatus sp.]|uniref:hypothetical protein n=1 Tax=Candidatus Binatus sp. TaxID=2811406 RepID=UPI003C78F297
MPAQKRVTLCIAATCEHKGKPCIVFCSDRKIVQGDVSSETGDKLSWFIPRWPILYAGTISRAHELIDVYRTELKRAKFKKSTIFDEFKRPPWIYKDKLLEDRSRKAAGLAYKEFLAQKSAFTDFDKLLAFITDSDIECELILGGFVDEESYLFVVDGEGGVSYEDDFAAIGSGADLATAVLRFRKQYSVRNLAETIYRLYEAKKFAQMEPNVGRRTFIDVLEPRGKDNNAKVRIRSLSKGGFQMLDSYYKQYGYQPIGKIQIDKKFLVRY